MRSKRQARREENLEVDLAMDTVWAMDTGMDTEMMNMHAAL